MPVGPGEHGPHRSARVPASVQQVQPLLPIRQLASQPGEGASGRAAASSAATRSASGSRQHWAANVSAAPGSASSLSPISVRSSATASLRGSRSRLQSAGTVSGDQARQGTPAGHDCHASGRAGQQRPDLLGIPGVVQQDQMRRPASRLRYRAARSSVSAGMSCPGMPRARRKPASASVAGMGGPGS